MDKISSVNRKPILAVILLSFIFIMIAAGMEAFVQGPLNVPGDIEFFAYVPGRYTLYRESKDPSTSEDGLNEVLQCDIHGCGHLTTLTPLAWYTGGIPLYLTDPKSGKKVIAMPFADFDILWPGRYHMHVEYSTAVDKHPDIVVGPKGCVLVAVIISVFAQIIVLFIYMQKKRAIHS